MTARRGKVWLVGAGPGDPGLLTLKGARAIQGCDTLVYDYLASQAIVDLAPPDCERIYVGKKAGQHTLTQTEITALIVKLALDGKRVVRLKGGDVFVFARGGEEAQALHAAGVAFDIVPGITSAIAAPAYAGIPVTHRDHNTSFSISTGHEDPLKGYTSLDYAKLANPKATTIFLMAMGNLTGIVDALGKNGLPGTTPVAIVREGTKPTQETLVATLETIVAEVERTRFAAPAIVVIGNVVNEREAIRWFDRAPLFGKRVLVTRPPAQAGEFAQQLWEAGAEPLLAPTIAIGPPDDPAAAAAAVAQVRDYAWVVFTSRNGVDAFFDLLGTNGKDARAFGDVKVAAIGPKTAAALTVRGIRVDFMPDVYVNEAVADGLAARTAPGDRVLIFRAQEARDVLPDALRAAKRTVDVVAAYKTRFVDDAALRAKAERADVVTFTSSSTVHGFVHNVADAAAVLAVRTVAAIGPITAATARNLGIRVDVVADEFTVEGLLQALETGHHRLNLNAVLEGGAVAALIALAAVRVHALTRGGAVAAFVVGTITFATGTLGTALLLLAFFVSSIALSRSGKKRKRELVDIGKGGARDALQVLANGGVATACALAWVLLDHGRAASPWFLAFAGAYAAATADTWGTEIGTLVAKPPRSILTGKPLATGLSGGVTSAGTAAEVAGAVLIAILTPGALLLALPGTGVTLHTLTALLPPVFLGGFGGALIDSLLGATLQDRRWCPACQRECEIDPHGCGTATIRRRGFAWLNNDGVNFIATASGAAIAAGVWTLAR